MKVDLPAVSIQGGVDGIVQDTLVPKHSVHQPNAPENSANNKNQMSYAEHLKETQSIAGGVGSLDEGLSQAALERLAAFFYHISVIQNGTQAL